MTIFLRPAILATTALIGLGGFAGLGSLPARAAPPPAASAAMPANSSKATMIEQRITDLHASLAITPAEQPQWKVFAQVMRDNAQAMDQTFQTRIAAIDTMTAPENLRSYEAIAVAHAQGLAKVVPAFQALYDSMPAAQQKVADQVFRDQPRHRAATQGG